MPRFNILSKKGAFIIAASASLLMNCVSKKPESIADIVIYAVGAAVYGVFSALVTPNHLSKEKNNANGK